MVLFHCIYVVPFNNLHNVTFKTQFMFQIYLYFCVFWYVSDIFEIFNKQYNMDIDGLYLVLFLPISLKVSLSYIKSVWDCARDEEVHSHADMKYGMSKGRRAATFRREPRCTEQNTVAIDLVVHFLIPVGRRLPVRLFSSCFQTMKSEDLMLVTIYCVDLILKSQSYM